MPSKTSTQPCIRSFSQAHCQFNPRPHAAEVSLLKRQLNEDPQSSGLLRSSQSSLSTPVHTSAGTAAVNLNLSKLAKVVKQPGSALLFVSTPLAKRASPHTKTNPRRAQNCQRAAWNPAEHKVECAAFKRWNVTHAATKRPGHKVAIPETPGEEVVAEQHSPLFLLADSWCLISASSGKTNVEPKCGRSRAMERGSGTTIASALSSLTKPFQVSD